MEPKGEKQYNSGKRHGFVYMIVLPGGYVVPENEFDLRPGVKLLVRNEETIAMVGSLIQ